MSHKPVLALGTLTTAIAQFCHRTGNSEARESQPKTAGSDVAGGAKTWGGTSPREDHVKRKDCLSHCTELVN